MNMMSNIDRRAFFRHVGIGVVAIGPVGGIAGLLTTPNTASALDADLQGLFDSAAPALEQGTAEAVVSPLAPGSVLATSTVTAIRAKDDHVSVEAETPDGSSFRLEIFARDDRADAPRPVARTNRFDLFVANGGSGDKRTERAHGLAAYALAEALGRNEALSGGVSFATLRARS
jgi:hypothetical protein